MPLPFTFPAILVLLIIFVLSNALRILPRIAPPEGEA